MTSTGPGSSLPEQPTSSTHSTHIQDRICSKLDEIVESEWRDPGEFLDPLTGGPFLKLRIGPYRLACTLDRNDSVLEVHRIEHRSGAYTADDIKKPFSFSPWLVATSSRWSYSSVGA